MKSLNFLQVFLFFPAPTVTLTSERGHFRALLTNFPTGFLFSAHCQIRVSQGLGTTEALTPFSCRSSHKWRRMGWKARPLLCILQGEIMGSKAAGTTVMQHPWQKTHKRWKRSRCEIHLPGSHITWGACAWWVQNRAAEQRFLETFYRKGSGLQFEVTD